MVVLHMNRKSTHDGCSFLLASASATFFFMFTSDDTLHRPFVLVRSLMERSVGMNYKSYTNADRERRAREGRSPCKKPYCKENLKKIKKQLPKYTFPDHVITAATLSKVATRKVPFSLYPDECKREQQRSNMSCLNASSQW